MPKRDLHLVITDSGLGGLSICAAIERNLRRAGEYGNVRITYFSAWEGTGYNDLPDIQSRARVFDRALSRMSDYRPDCILVACNTLSIIYEETRFRRAPLVPVRGIIDEGVELFVGALNAEPASSIILFGTRTTIESGVHRNRMVGKGIDVKRIVTVASHGLAGAIERDPDGTAVGALIAKAAFEAALAERPGDPLYVGFCCTHYAYVRDRFASEMTRTFGKPVRILDPNHRLVSRVAPDVDQSAAGEPCSATAVEVLSKVPMDAYKRHVIAERIRPVSGVTAEALLSYSLALDLF